MALYRNIHVLIDQDETLLDREYSQHVVKGNYDYYHYGVDGVNDEGWGCAYRSLQTIGSWILLNNLSSKKDRGVPSMKAIQWALVEELQDKPKAFMGSREWIGAVEVAMCLDHFFDVSAKIVHIPKGSTWWTENDNISLLASHFEQGGGPVMIGGGTDTASKTVIGVKVLQDENGSMHDSRVLIADPHMPRECNQDEAVCDGWVQWETLQGTFQADSFYNMCIPMVYYDDTVNYGV
eukprot:Nk52_evm79s207 gene=Nk52_evmTU79s207